MHFTFIFSGCITITSSEEGLKVCEYNLFQRKVILLVMYLFNHASSKPTIFMLNMAFDVHLSAVSVKCSKLESFISCNTLREEILVGRNFSGKKIWRIWRNLIWRMPKNYKFEGNLIWRIRENKIIAEFNLANDQNNIYFFELQNVLHVQKKVMTIMNIYHSLSMIKLKAFLSKSTSLSPQSESLSSSRTLTKSCETFEG